ncbi:MAG: hypothetical protein ABEJ44_07900 [Halanaeroarchaeum sp.]
MSALLGRMNERLDALRDTPSRRRLGTLGAVVVGLVAVWAHWVGFVLGGALVAHLQPSIRRGVLAALSFGLVSWLSFTAWLATTGDVHLYLGMGQVLGVSTAVALVGSLLGALARGIR